MRYKKIWVALGSLLLSAACGAGNRAESESGISLRPPDTFEEADLVGTWEEVMSIYSSETLTIYPDYTFQQIYDGGAGYRFEGIGKWRLEQAANGCLYAHFEGMRYYYSSLGLAENGNKFPESNDPMLFWDPCGQQTLEMPDEVIMIVATNSTFPRKIMLQHLSSERGVGEIVLRLDIENAP